MDDMVLIVPDAIPYPGTAVEILEGAAADMRKAAGEISEGGSGIEASWQGLQTHYKAPEAEDLFAAMEPVRTKGDTIHDDLTTVAGALETFAEAAAHAQKNLRRLREEARDFVAEVAGDPEWNGDLELVTTNRALIYAVNKAWGDFQEAERDCANALENVTGSGSNYVAGSMTDPVEPEPGDVVYGIDPDEIPDVAYDLTEWDEWQRAFTDGWHFLEEGDHGWPMDWVVDASMAQWDYFGPGMLWDVGVGAVAATGLWREGRGWATSTDEVITNFVDHKTETLQGYGAMAGLYGEDGWMNPLDADERSWETFKENAGPVWTEVAHDIVPWREWDDRPAYTVYTGAGNIALSIVGLPVRGGMLAARASEIAAGAGRLIPDWDMSVASRLDFDLGRHLSGLGTGTGTTLAGLDGRLQELTLGLAQKIGSWGSGSQAPVFVADTSNGTGLRPLHTDGPEGATTAEAARRAENAAASGSLHEIEEELHLRQEPAAGAPDTVVDPTGRRDPEPDTTDPQESTSWRGDRSTVVDGTFTPEDSSHPDAPTPDHDTLRDRSDGGPETAERREPEFLQRSGGIVGNNNPRINLEEGDGFYDANGDLVEVGHREHTGTYIDAEGNRYVDVPESAQALERYREIRADDGDIDRIAANTGFDRDVVDEIKQHIFFREHPDIASPPDGRLRTGRFAPMDHIADLWHKAETGTLDASEANAFRRLVAHEYVEARLMQEGVPYRSRDPKLWHDDYYMPTRDNNGAHDISPLNWKDDGFALWEKWGIPKPDADHDFRLADDMSNLNAVAAGALAWWRHQNPNGGFPFERRPAGSAPGMAIDADTDPGRSPHTPDPSLYENHPSTHTNPDLIPDTGDKKPRVTGNRKTNDERLKLAEPYLVGLDTSSKEAYVNGFMERLNSSPALRNIFYRDKDGHRWSEKDKFGPNKDWSLPQIKKDPQTGRWIKEPKPESPYYLGEPVDVRLDVSGVDHPEGLHEALKKLDWLAGERRMSIDAAAIAKKKLEAVEGIHGKYKEKGVNHPEVEKAKRRYQAAQTYSTRICEKFGEEVAKVGAHYVFNGEEIIGNDGNPLESHMVDGDGETVYDDRTKKPKTTLFRPNLEGAELLGTSDAAPDNGNGRFDLIYRTLDGDIIIIEAKSSVDTDLGSRQPDGGSPRRVSQGHIDYFWDIVAVMKESCDPREVELAMEIEKKMEQGKVIYSVFKGAPKDHQIKDSEVPSWDGDAHARESLLGESLDGEEGGALEINGEVEAWNDSSANGYRHQVFDIWR